MAVVLYIWLIPLALLVLGGLGGLYLRVKQEWPPQTENSNRSDHEIALEMEAREDAEAARRAAQTNPS